MLTFVLPIGSEFDYKLANELLIPSFNYFKSGKLEYKFIIIYKKDLHYLVNNFNKFDNFVLIDENQLLDTSKIKNTYYLQMYLKLLICNNIKTDFYVTLDCDIFFTNMFDENNFYKDNKAYVNIKKNRDAWTKRVNKYLNLNTNFRTNQTPFIFKTDLVKKMFNELNVYDLILNKLCSEYTLYTAFLDKNNLLNFNYIDNNFKSGCLKYSNVNNKSDNEIINMFNNLAKTNFIVIIQSRLELYDILQNEFKKIIPSIKFNSEKIGLMSVVGGVEYFNRYHTSLLLKKKYCKKHLYDFIFRKKKEKVDGWFKIDILLKEMKKKIHKYIFVSDTDVTLTNKDIRIENIIKRYYKSEALCYLTTDLNSINTGNVIWKVCDESIELLEKINKIRGKIRYSLKTPFIPKGIYEQPSLIYLYNKDIELRNKIVIIPQFEINSYSHLLVKEGNVIKKIDNIENRSIWKEGDFLVHYAGINYETYFKNIKINNFMLKTTNFYIKYFKKGKAGQDSNKLF